MSRTKPIVRAGDWELGQNMPPRAQEMVNNPEVLAFFGALGLVMITAFVAFIMGVAQDSARARASRTQGGK